MLPGGVSRTGVFPWPGNLATPRAVLSPHCPPCVLSSLPPGGRSPGFLQPPVIPRQLPTRQGGSSPLCKTPELGCPVCGSRHSLPREGLCPFPSRVISLNPITFLPFSSNYVWIISSSFHLVFSHGFSTHRCIFDVFMGRR